MLQKSSIYQTLEVFFIYPTKNHYLMDIARHIELAHTSVKKNLNELIKIGLIKEFIEKKGIRKFPIYTSDINNKLFKKYKLIYNFSSILESNLINFIED